ncbi:FAD-dependent thymidylate synthase [Candidatus Microgenomates bacterium]|nr:FAD-dependent thymidylate synthase [Candidatus Microgenomates bacterium]
MKLSFRKDLNIASLVSESNWNKFKVHTLLQNSEKKQPSINAYLGARYSRSSDSIIDIANEIMKSNTDAAEKLEKIFSGYGHKSVGDMADLFVCVENIPIYTAMKFFYMTSVVAGQERSTRYQNFDNPEFVKIPREVCDDNEVRKGYERIMMKQMKDYREMLKVTKDSLSKVFQINEESQQEVSALKSRTFDVVRYFLPYGLNTSDAFLMSARNWSEIISYLCSSDSVVENELYSLLLNLLGESKLDVKGYIREADGLLRHTDANCCRKISTKEILAYLDKTINREQVEDIITNECDSVTVTYAPDCTETLISHYESLLNPLGSKEEFEFSEEDQENIGSILFDNHDHHHLMGNIGQSGAIKISGFASLGTLKDLNRHRSLERFIPLFHDEIDLDQELKRKNSECFVLCDYLEIQSLSKLKKEFQSRLEETYEMIKEWRKSSKDVLSKEVCDEFTKYLLPHAHSTRYIFYGSFDDYQYIINLRTRNGGHIAYRRLVYQWLRKLSYKDLIWRPLLKKIVEPRIDDKHQFIDRS